MTKQIFKRPIFLGAYHVDVTFTYPPGTFTAEWTPYQPTGDELTDDMLDSYRAQRNAFLEEIMNTLHIPITVIDPK